jgi:hypothetical protein
MTEDEEKREEGKGLGSLFGSGGKEGTGGPSPICADLRVCEDGPYTGFSTGWS